MIEFLEGKELPGIIALPTRKPLLSSTPSPAKRLSRLK